MDIFLKNKRLIKTVYVLTFLNIITLSLLVWKFVSAHEPLLFPKKEAYKDVSGILKKELNLSEKQVRQFDEIRKRNFEKQAALKKIIRDDKDAMNEEMFNITTDEKKVQLLAKRIAEHEYQMELLRLKQAKELKAVCNGAQLRKFHELVKEIRDYFRPDNQPDRK